MFDSSVERGPHSVFPRAPQRNGGAWKHALAELATSKTAKESDPRRTTIGIYMRPARQITIDRNLIDVTAQLTPALLEERSGA